ncbi:MAG TPA: hypothetical protein PKC21_04485 [Oligoflexia bacterium]|nr:hypothetical protein [Oligoflexia bacterium]HMR24595.1 hypothetical protein [Oligoflexia bacterium]
MDEKMTMNAKIKTILTYGVLAISILSLNFCAPPVPDYGSGIQKLYGNANPSDAWNTYNAQVCADMGGFVEADGSCSTTYTAAGFTDECESPSSQAQVLACNEQDGVKDNGGQFWGAVLAVMGKEVLNVVQDLKNENIHGQWLKTYTKKVLNVTSPNGTPLDGESSLNPGALKKHRLFFRKYPSQQGVASLQFELEAKGDSIATLKNIEYGKTLLMCLNAAYGHDASNDNSVSDTRIALQMRAKYNSHEAPVKISQQDFYNNCNQPSQEQSYIAFQLHGATTYHVFPFNPKDMGFSKAGNNNNIGSSNKYTIEVNGQSKEMRYYAAQNQLDLGMNGNNVASAMFTDAEFGTTATNNQVLNNISQGTSSSENNYSSFSNRQEFQKQYLHITTGTDNNERKFCNANSAQVGC